MIKILRKHRNWLMIVIAILALPFCLYFVKTDYQPDSQDQFRGDVRPKSYDDLRRARRPSFQLADVLGMSDLRETLTAGTGTRSEQPRSFIINLIVLRHEADGSALSPRLRRLSMRCEIFRRFRAIPVLTRLSTRSCAERHSPRSDLRRATRELARDELCLNENQGLWPPAFRFRKAKQIQLRTALRQKFVSVVRLKPTDLSKTSKSAMTTSKNITKRTSPN